MVPESASSTAVDKRIPVSVFEHVAATYPANVAVSHGGREITFGDLAAHVDRIAAALRSEGVGRDVIVAMCFESSIEYVAALLAVMKAGGIFMPIDLHLPGPRIESILDLATPALAAGSPAGIEALLALPLGKSIEERGVSLMTLDAGLAVQVRRAPGSPRIQAPSIEPPGPDDSSYIMFTSGSTGKPKGILGRTKSLGHFMHWEAREFGFDESLRVSQFPPLTFDASLRDILLPLTVGGRLCIPPQEVRGNASRLVDWLEHAGVTLVHCVPSLFRLLMSEVEARGGGDGVLPRLRHVLMAGEALYGSDVMRWMDLVGSRIELVNLYGPSETTLIKTFHRVPERPASKGIIAIGKPLSNTAVLVVKGNRLCEIGEIGDIYIDTPFASKGYFKDPERTAEAFVANPIAPDGGVVYKTGDLGRYLPDRSLEFVGRLDTQVKVNGIRIELGEVQSALAGFAAIELAIVLALPNADQENRLVCYYTEKQPTNPQDIRAHLGTTLPEYMIPSFYVRMEQFPLTVTGKVDRKALPKPEELLYDQAGYEPPAGDVEQRIAAIWSDVLSLGKVGATSRFTELGGNSLRAIRIISRISRGFGVELTIPAFFEHATVRKLARVVGEAETAQPFSPIPIAQQQAHDQLSHAQQRLWILGQIEQGLTAYNNTHAVVLDGSLDRDALRRALAALLQRHESLRTSMVTIDDKPRQVVLTGTSLPIIEHDLRELSDPDAALRDHIVAASKTAFDLAQGPLIRLHVLRLPASPEGAERHALVLAVHHIVADGWSMSVLQRELSAGYRAFRTGGDDPLPPLRIQYRDFCAWQRGRLESDAAAAHRDYWLGQLSGDIRGLDLPADHPRPAAFTFTGRTRRFQLSPELTSRLKRLAESADASLFMVLVAAVKVLLHRYTGRTDIIVGTPIAGRDHADLEDQVGFYASTLVLRDELSAERSFLETLADVRQTCLDAYQHQAYPFDLLLGGLRLERDASRNPVFDVMVVMQEAQEAAFTLDGLAVTEVEVGEEFSRFDLTFNFQEVEDCIQLDLNYNDALFEPDRITRLASHLTQLCASLLDDPGQPIARLDILPADERRRLESYSRTAPAAAETRTLIELFEDQARRTPHRPAVVCGERTLSYEALNARAGQLAGFLRASSSVARGDVVGVSLERSEWGMIAAIAILKVQGVYMPIDPQLPAERVAHMLGESECRVVLVDQDAAPSWCAGAGLGVELVAVHSVGDDTPASVLGSSDAPAYVIYTSGSTGWPKGVMVSSRAFVNTIVAQRDAFAVTEQDRVLQFFATSFDGSLSEMFTALLSGAALVLVDRATILDAADFAAFMRRQAITVVQLSPSYLHRLEPGALDSVKTLIMAGEAAISEDARAQARERRTFNAYGPTEAAVCATLHRVSADDDRHDGFVPIGRPIAGIEILVLDEYGAPAPIGIPGEIGIAGTGLAIGYSHRPDLTAERFVPHPVRGGGRLYRTGDRGCWLDDGTLRFVGRLDDQVKVGGHRIECGEVERCLLQVAGVREAAVLVRETGGGAQLAACLVGVERERVPDVRAQLKRRLPDFMVPALLTVVDHLPLSPGGKVDKRALARLLDKAGHNEPPTAPRTGVERELAGIWERVLGRTGLGIDDDFFDAGGTSLAAIEVLAAVRRQFETSVAVLDLYRSPTVRGLAERLAPSAGRADARPFILYNQHAERTVFCFPAVADPDGLIYGRLAAALPSWRLCGLQFTTSEGASAVALADLIQEVQPQGPYTLLGYSAGGNLAFTAARELERRKSVVANLALVDSYHRDRVEPLAAADRQALIDHQVQNAAVLDALGEEASPGGLTGRMGQYLDVLNSGVDEGAIDAPIHLLRAEDRLDVGAGSGWARATTAGFSESAGTGTHQRMLGDQHLRDNARRLAAILDPGHPLSEVENES